MQRGESEEERRRALLCNLGKRSQAESQRIGAGLHLAADADSTPWVCSPRRASARDLKSGSAKGSGAPGGKTPNQLRLLYSVIEQQEKIPQLLRFIQLHAKHKVIVYFLTCACVDFFVEVLQAAPETTGVVLTPLHGRMKQARPREEGSRSSAPGATPAAGG